MQIEQSSKKNILPTVEEIQQKNISSPTINQNLTVVYDAIPPLEKYPAELEKHFDIIENSGDKEKIRQSFVQIHTLIKSKLEYFNPRAPYHHMIEKLVDVLNKFFDKYQNNNFEFYKGLIFLSNMVLWLDKSYAQTFLMTNPHLLLQLSKFYQTNQRQKERNEGNNNAVINENSSSTLSNMKDGQSQELMQEQSILALIAQLIHQTHRSDLEVVQQIRGSLLKKNFINKILGYNIENIQDEKRKADISKILSLLLMFFVKNRASLLKFKLLPKTKNFLLTQIKHITDPKNLNSYLSCLHYLCETQTDLRFNARELTKNQTIEKIIECLNPDLHLNIVWCAVRILKQFLKYPTAKIQMLKLQVIQKMFNVFRLNPRGVAQFFEEMMVQETDRYILQVYFQQFNTFVQSQLSDPSLKKEEFRHLLKIVKEGVNCFSEENLLQFLQNNTLNHLWQNFSQQDIRIKEIVLENIYLILNKTESIQVQGRPYALKKLEAIGFDVQIKQLQQQYQLYHIKVQEHIFKIYDRYYRQYGSQVNELQQQKQIIKMEQDSHEDNNNNADNDNNNAIELEEFPQQLKDDSNDSKNKNLLHFSYFKYKLSYE